MMNVWVEATLWLVAGAILMMFLGHRKRRRSKSS